MSHRHPSGKNRRRGGQVVGLAAAAGAFFAAGVPDAHADIDDLITQPLMDAIDQAGAAAAGTDAVDSATVPLSVSGLTEPVVNLSVGGGASTPVLVDTGSDGLVIPWQDIGLQDIGFPTGINIGTLSGGLDYLYVTLPSDVSFTTTTGADITTAQTPVDVELFSWPTTPGGPSSLSDFLGGDADGILGVGPNAIGPGPSSPITALPGALGDGVLIDQPAGQLVFGPDPLAGGVPVSGAPDANLDVSIAGGAPTPVSAIVDSGGVYGNLPSSLFGGEGAGDVLKPGTVVSVSTGDGQPLYSYTVSAGSANSPVITASTDPNGTEMNTGNIPFEQMPVYISNSPSGQGTTIFGGTP